MGIAQRLKMSKAILKRRETAMSETAPARALAYRLGPDVARDIVLKGDEPIEALALLDDWTRPPLPIKGGDLVAHGLKAGPTVAATLQAIERRWIEEDFPDASRVDQITSEELAKALRSAR